MPHVSKKKLSKKHEDMLYAKLVEVFGSGKDTETLFDEFFTETEKTMYAKRLAVIYLLYKQVPTSYIYETLGMSPATVARMSVQFETGKFKHVVSKFKKIDASFWDVLESVLRAGLPPIAGRGRWKFLYED